MHSKCWNWMYSIRQNIHSIRKHGYRTWLDSELTLLTLDSGHLYKWGTFYVIKNVTTNQFLLFPNLNTFLPFLRLGSTNLILTHQGHISKVSKTRVSLQYHFSVNSDFLSNLRYLVSAGDSVFKAHRTQYNIQSHFSSSCWVFQPMGRWFSSQDRKRSFGCHSVRLRQSDSFIEFWNKSIWQQFRILLGPFSSHNWSIDPKRTNRQNKKVKVN